MPTNAGHQLTILEDRLRRYVPEQMVDPLLAKPGLATAHPCVEHLDGLLHAVSTYLPRYLVEEELRDPEPGRVSGQFRQTTILFADISGFTALSERLSHQGEKGAEKITNIVGDYFTTMLDITGRRGGDLLKFGGDALLVAFFGDDHALAACRAAAQMQQAIARFSQVEAFDQVFSLKMTAGLGSGPLFTANLGTPEKMEYTAMGQALARMAQAEEQAEGGEIFIDEATYRAVEPYVETGDVRDGCFQVTHVEGSDTSSTPLPELTVIPELEGEDLESMVTHVQKTITCLDVLVPFLPPGLLDMLRFAPARMASREKGEFRPVTTIFANFYGIEEIIGQLGPEKAVEITAILNAHFTTMHEIIHQYEGVIDKVDSYVVGHRIMALFGAPRAHVDDPERAVRAAWEMQTAMAAFSQLETSAGTFALKQRIGINTGRVFAGNVGSDTRHEYSVMGDEVNLTARLMSIADEGQVLISQSTATQVGKRFRLSEQAPVRVKGKSEPVPNYEVQGTIERHEAQAAVRRSPLVGRDEEWALIWQVAQRASQGDPQILDLHGEMGMGKSRVIEELIGRWNEEERQTLFASCPSYGRHTPYAPWATILRQVFGLRNDDTDQERGEKIIGRLAVVNPEWVEWAPVVAQMLGVPMDENELTRSLDAKLRQQNLKRIISGLIAAEGMHRPTLVVVDDVQWIDEVSLSLLNYLTDHITSGPLLICVTYRPQDPPDLTATGQPNCTAIALESLPEKNSLALLESQLPTEPEMPRRLKEMILENAQGTPLYIVEMAHALIENYLSYDAEEGVYRARADLERVQVPDTVSRVILSRLDRLDEQSRNMLKVASVIGREFQRWLLQSVYPYQADEAEIETRLTDLCRKEILDRLQVAFLFRHVMTREVAYESLLYAERRKLHLEIARSIEEQRGDRPEEYVEVLAEHYTLAEAWPLALAYHLRAGQRAQAIYANEDAIHRYGQVLEIAGQVPDSQGAEMAAYQGLGDTHQLIGQYDEALESYAQARSLLDNAGDSPEIRRQWADLCRRTAHVYECKSEYGTALEWVERGLKPLSQSTHPLETVRLYIVRAAVYHRQGNNQEAVGWCDQGIRLASGLPTSEGAEEIAHAAHLMGEIYRRLGDNDKAIASAQRSLDIYRDLEQVTGQGQAYISLANVYFEQSRWQAAMDHYLESLKIKERIGDTYGQGVLAINIGEIHRIRGQMEQAITFYRRSQRMWDELGVTYGQGLVHNNLGAVYLRLGDLEQAGQHLDRSEALFAQIPSEDFVAETCRYRAQVALRRGALDEALAQAERSLKYAQEQGLKADECATRRVLGMIHRHRGDVEQCRALLTQSLYLAYELDSQYEIGRTLLQIGLLKEQEGKPDEARASLHQARAIFEDLEARLDLEEVDDHLASMDHES